MDELNDQIQAILLLLPITILKNSTNCGL